MRGAEFLARYGGTPDAVTRVDPDRDYAVRAPTRHPIAEHARIRIFAQLLATPADAAPEERRRAPNGSASDVRVARGYAQCGLDSAGTSRLVALVREAAERGRSLARDSTARASPVAAAAAPSPCSAIATPRRSSPAWPRATRRDRASRRHHRRVIARRDGVRPPAVDRMHPRSALLNVPNSAFRCHFLNRLLIRHAGLATRRTSLPSRQRARPSVLDTGTQKSPPSVPRRRILE